MGPPSAPERAKHERRGSREVRDRDGAPALPRVPRRGGLFSYVVETERRFYLANDVKVEIRNAGSDVYFEVAMSDAWVWDMYRPARFVKNVRVITFKDVNVEEIAKSDLEPPRSGGTFGG